MSDPTNILDISDLAVSYGRMTAVRGVNLSLQPGSITVIVGPNGAGKSTIMNTIAGGVRPAEGNISFRGTSIRKKRPESIASMGISLVPEGRHVFPTLSVRENLLVASFMRKDRSQVEGDMERMFGLFPRLRERFKQAAGKLSGGEQQMLVIARALMTRPTLLMIDEPSLGLAPKIVDEVYETLMAARSKDNLTLLINEQTSKRALNVADTVHVLREGRVRLSGSPAALREGTTLSDAYFGTSTHQQHNSIGGAQ
ncbi:ABC transporter ATP-binding protein [Mesorhizobium sp. CCNWLW179-1]|uniref:ABC transporter ATP-binding protein n=1 Tax=unclassified Mesorhizobium TaxID=325217 RepID=UPI003014E9F4